MSTVKFNRVFFSANSHFVILFCSWLLDEQVIGLLGGNQPNGSSFMSEKPVKAEATTVELPNLIDTDDSNENQGGDDFISTVDPNVSSLAPSSPLVDDLFGDFNGSVESSIEQKNNDDPFADVSFHTNENKGQADDLFSGMTVGDKQSDSLTHGMGSISEPEAFDFFASESAQPNHEHISDLMSGLSVNENTSSTTPKTTSSTSKSESLLSDLNSQFSHQAPDNALHNMLNPQAVGFNANPMFPTGNLPYNMQPGIMLNHMYPSQPLNYNAMGSLLAQQQFLATMANFQHLSNVSMQDASVAQIAGNSDRMPMPDIFQSNFPTQTPTSTMISNTKKEDSKAFDFISVSGDIDLIYTSH